MSEKNDDRAFWSAIHSILLSAVTAVEKHKLGLSVTTKDKRDWYKKIVRSSPPQQKTHEGNNQKE